MSVFSNRLRYKLEHRCMHAGAELSSMYYGRCFNPDSNYISIDRGRAVVVVDMLTYYIIMNASSAYSC